MGFEKTSNPKNETSAEADTRPASPWVKHARTDSEDADGETGTTPPEKVLWKRHASRESHEQRFRWGLSKEERNKQEIAQAAIIEEVKVMGIQSEEDLANAMRIITTKFDMSAEEARRFFHGNTLIPPMVEDRILHELIKQEKATQKGMSRSK